MRTGAMISGGAHSGLLILAIFGANWFAPEEAVPLDLIEIEMVDGTDFDALLSTAPIVPNEGPAELSEPNPGESAPENIEQPEDAAQPTEIAELQNTEPPEPRPDQPEINIPPPPTNVPTEAPAPSEAEIPVIDELDRQAAEAESPPSTEPVQPLASKAPVPGAKPTPPPAPEPEPEDQPDPEPVEQQEETPEAVVEKQPEPELEQKPDDEAVAEVSPEAPLGPAPQEAKLPIAKPSDLAAAARAAAKAEQVAQQSAQPKEETPKPARQSGGSTSRLAAKLTRGEKSALRLGIKQFFTYNGDRSDKSLTVVIQIKLDKSGKIIGKPKRLRATGGTKGTQNVLFNAGRRALARAGGAGEFQRLPGDKYDRWKLINVTFTIDKVGFSS